MRSLHRAKCYCRDIIVPVWGIPWYARLVHRLSLGWISLCKGKAGFVIWTPKGEATLFGLSSWVDPKECGCFVAGCHGTRKGFRRAPGLFFWGRVWFPQSWGEAKRHRVLMTQSHWVTQSKGVDFLRPTDINTHHQDS